MISSSFLSFVALWLVVFSGRLLSAPEADAAKDKEVAAENARHAAPAKPEDKPAARETAAPADDSDEEAAEKLEAVPAAVALPVSAEPVQIYGWYENVHVGDMEEHLLAKLDTGALTSSIHAEKKELFERDGKKWVRFIVANTFRGKVVRARMEAPLVRTARIKEPNAESVAREVVRLSFRIGDRKLRSEFTLNNRSNMVAPVLIGRSTLKDLGWVDPSRTFLADQKIMR